MTNQERQAAELKVKGCFAGTTQDQNFKVTSPPDKKYNCIAWAVDFLHKKFMWPNADGYWPNDLPKQETVAAFDQMFRQYGYTPCGLDESLEPGVEKVALYANANLKPTHAARQVDETTWWSKLGRENDIYHSLKSIEGQTYGQVIGIYKRAATGKVPPVTPHL